LARLQQDGIRRQAVSLPVGSGKTVILCNLIKQLPGQGKTLILAHREELLQQAVNQCAKFLPDKVSFAFVDSFKKSS
jgi:ATP-dependent helicase IRC3